MKKNIFVVMLLITLMFFGINTVSAKEVFYKNNNGVTFTEEEYEFLSMMFWDGCQRLAPYHALKYVAWFPGAESTFSE